MPQPTETVELAIEGMSCDHCVRAVQDALRGVPGVTIDRVAIGRATITYDPTQTTLDEVLDAVADEGYTAQRAD
jgi:copper chaperone CopZ